MNRREFLLMKQVGNNKVVELSCEQLFMHYESAWQVDPPVVSDTPGMEDKPWWDGEPATDVRSTRLNELLAYLERHLGEVDVLQVSHRNWLKDEGFKAQVYGLLTEFQSRGGTVEFLGSEATN